MRKKTKVIHGWVIHDEDADVILDIIAEEGSNSALATTIEQGRAMARSSDESIKRVTVKIQVSDYEPQRRKPKPKGD